jgi:hypothetical protein
LDISIDISYFLCTGSIFYCKSSLVSSSLGLGMDWHSSDWG